MTDQNQAAAQGPPAPVYARMAVIGGGLIGSSVIRAARSHGAVGEVMVADANPAHRERLAVRDPRRAGLHALPAHLASRRVGPERARGRPGTAGLLLRRRRRDVAPRLVDRKSVV